MGNTNFLSIVPPNQFDYGWKKMQNDTSNTALMIGAGTTGTPVEAGTIADKNFIGWWLKTTATSGTTRGMYLRLYLNSGAGGEAARLFTTVSSDTPADTVNGAHVSLSFGASAGNVTGLGTALRATLHVPNRALTGTTAAVKAELTADGASSSNSGLMGFFRATLGGNATGAATVEDTANLLVFSGGTNASGNVVGALNGNEPTWTSKTGLIRVNLNGVTAYLVAVTL